MKFNPTAEEFDVQEFTPIKEGSHLVMVSDVQFKISANSGNPMVVCEFKIIDQSNRDAGREIKFQFYVLTRKALWRYAQLCRAIDPKMRAHDPEEQSELNELLLNKPLCVTTENKLNSYNGKDTIRTGVKFHKALKMNQIKALKDQHGFAMVPHLDNDVDDDEMFDKDIPF